MKIHHIGIACNDIRFAEMQYKQLGYKVIKELITDYERNLDFIFLENEGNVIELISKNDLSKKSDIDNVLSQVKMIGNKMYHICYSTNELEADINRLVKLGYKLIKPPSLAVACDNKTVAFLVHINMGIVELIEE